MDKNLKQIKPMLCPVCGRFYFTELNEYELANGETPNEVQCSRCGWYYDLEQVADPNLKNQSNEMSLNEYKEWYKQKIKEKKNWTYYIENMPPKVPFKCPVCGEYVFKDYQDFTYCPVCGFENNGFDDRPDERIGDYCMTLNERKKWFSEQRKLNPKFKWKNTMK